MVNPRVRSTGPTRRSEETTIGSRWPDPWHDPHLAGHDPTQPAKFPNLLTRPDLTRELAKLVDPTRLDP